MHILRCWCRETSTELRYTQLSESAYYSTNYRNCVYLFDIHIFHIDDYRSYIFLNKTWVEPLETPQQTVPPLQIKRFFTTIIIGFWQYLHLIPVVQSSYLTFKSAMSSSWANHICQQFISKLSSIYNFLVRSLRECSNKETWIPD